jgi:hypothetical protein
MNLAECVVIKLPVLINLTILREEVTTARSYVQPNTVCAARAGQKVVRAGIQTMGAGFPLRC